MDFEIEVQKLTLDVLKSLGGWSEAHRNENPTSFENTLTLSHCFREEDSCVNARLNAVKRRLVDNDIEELIGEVEIGDIHRGPDETGPALCIPFPHLIDDNARVVDIPYAAITFVMHFFAQS